MKYLQKICLLISIVAVLCFVIGYRYAEEGTQHSIVFIVSIGLLLVAALVTIKSIRDEIANRYYWYEQLLDALPTPLSVTDLDMNWTFINEPVEKLFNEPRRDFIGRPCNQWGARICKTENCGVARLRQGNNETFFTQFDREFRVDTHYLYNLQGKKIGHAEVCTDITAILEVTKAAEATKRNNAELKSAYEQLKKTQQTLLEAEKMASLGALVAGVAHEINTPIGICVTASSTMDEKVQAFQTKVTNNQLSKRLLKQFINDILDSTALIELNLERAADLVTSFKQVAVDQTNEEKYAFNLSSHLQQVVRSLQHKLSTAEVQMSIYCDDNLHITSFPGVFTQIYSKLILNSLTHAFDEPQRQGLIDIKIHDLADNVEIHYSDNGKGMAPEIVEKIFEPFFTTRRGQGKRGLGAHILYNLVTQKLKGQVHCESNLDEGCRFYISIPKTLPTSSKLSEETIDVRVINTKIEF